MGKPQATRMRIMKSLMSGWPAVDVAKASGLCMRTPDPERPGLVRHGFCTTWARPGTDHRSWAGTGSATRRRRLIGS